MSAVLAGSATAAAVLLWLARPRAVPVPVGGTPPASPDWVTRGRHLWSLLAGVGAWALWSGWSGVAVGVVAAALVHHLVSAAEPAELLQRREAMRRDLPVLVLLLATVLRSGAATVLAVRQACAALPGPAADALVAACDRLALGADPEQVWSDLAAEPAMAPLGRALARAHRTGAPVAAAVERLADDLAAEARSTVEDRARAVGVRAAVPLGVCLLPSFLLLGIVPLVASLLAGLRL